jgi:hypothetical protein
MRAIITLNRSDGSIVGKPIPVDIDESGDIQAQFDKLNEEYAAKVADPSDDITNFQILGA